MRRMTIYLLMIGAMCASEAQTPGFAVVELFTSQGCSSCPSADRVLSELIDGADNLTIYGLSFHVDYWNYLGWKDPYSSKAYTTRQRNYAAQLKSSVYTPQMVINGLFGFVGSRKEIAREQVEKALRTTPSNGIVIRTERHNHSMTVTFQTSGTLVDKVINLALVERDVSTQVLRGENRNRTLHHDNVVRAFRTLTAQRNGELTLQIPADFNDKKGAIIAYIQDRGTLEISGASMKKLRP